VPAIDDIWHAATLKGCFPIAYADAFAAALVKSAETSLGAADTSVYATSPPPSDTLRG
jgi:hypothetical protein